MATLREEIHKMIKSSDVSEKEALRVAEATSNRTSKAICLRTAICCIVTSLELQRILRDTDDLETKEES